MTTEAAKRAIKKYDEKNTVMVSVKLNKQYDSDIIKKLNMIGNKQKYIKTVIRHEIYFNKSEKSENSIDI